MPIYEHSYRRYEGDFRRRFRWLIVLQQELRILLRSRIFIAFLLVGLLHVILRLLQLVAYDVIMQDPNNPMTPILKQIRPLMVDEQTFFDFIRIQGGLVLVATLFAGSGMICNDFGNNLMEVYFSKPLSWRDYALGKISTLMSIGLGLTAAPALVLVLLHNLLLPRLSTITESASWLPGIIGFSFILVTPCALVTLACSALLRSQNYAAIAVFMVLIADSIMGGLLAAFLRNNAFGIAAFPLAQNHLGELLFGVRPGLEASWQLALAFVLTVCTWALWVVCRRVRRAEIPA